MALAKVVLMDVREAFARHLSVPDSPMRQDVTGIGLQLYRWRSQTVGYVVEVLLDYAVDLPRLAISAPASTGASVADAHGALVVVNTILTEEHWRYTPTLGALPSTIRREYANFHPID